MSFRVSEEGEAGHKIILLEDESAGTKVQIYAFGALLNSFSVKLNDGEINLVEGFQNIEDAFKNITPAFQSAKLSPFVCRLKEGQYTFANIKHKTEKYYYNREALHGLVYDAIFLVAETGTSEDSAFVTLSYDYNKNDPGFPFHYLLQITYRLQDGNDLSITTKVTNASQVSIPMSDGWHPYFTFGKKVDKLELCIKTNQMVEFDNKLLPTGRFMPFENFSQSQKISDTQLDNSFVLSAERDSNPACTLRDPEIGLQLSIYPDISYPYLQIFTPEHRNSIAIENLSSLPDAFNNGLGLIILEPSASTSFTTRFVISTT